jgi:hypothetical protein
MIEETDLRRLCLVLPPFLKQYNSSIVSRFSTLSLINYRKKVFMFIIPNKYHQINYEIYFYNKLI